MLADRAQHDHPHALVLVQRLEHQAELVALRHFEVIERSCPVVRFMAPVSKAPTRAGQECVAVALFAAAVARATNGCTRGARALDFAP